MQSMGANGGNELSLIGSWLPIGVNNGNIGFWGMLNRIDNNVAKFPKYTGASNYTAAHNCDNFTKSTDTVGSGLALRLDGVVDYVDASNDYMADDYTDNYTVEIWIRPEYLGTNQYIWSYAYGANPASNSLYIGTDNQIHWKVTTNSGTAVSSLSTGTVVEVNKWYHLAAVKSGSTYSLYINGTLKASGTGNLTVDCPHSRLILGATLNNGNTNGYYRGRIDEFRLWNTAITNITTIRDWMCRKIKGGQHPNFANLQQYYRFDVVNGTTVKDQFKLINATTENIGFNEYSNYFESGAPIGDNSVYIYPANWTSTSLTYFNPNGDKFTVTGLGSGNPDGVRYIW